MKKDRAFRVVICRIGEEPVEAVLTREQIRDVTGWQQSVVRPSTLERQGDVCPLSDNVAFVCDDNGRMHPEATVNRFGLYGDFVAVADRGDNLTQRQVDQVIFAVGEYDRKTAALGRPPKQQPAPAMKNPWF